MKLVHAGLVLGLSTAVRMVANLVVVKMIALHLGTDGMGYLGQFMSVVALTTALAGGGIAMGLTKYVAGGAPEEGGAFPHVRAAVVIWLVTGAVFFVLVAANARALSAWLFGTPAYESVFWAVAGAQFAIGAYNLLSATLNGRHDVTGLAAVNTLGAVLGAAITSLLVVTAGLVGAMWGLILAPCAGLVFAAIQVVRKGYLRGLWRAPRPQPHHYRQLLSFAVMLVVTVSTMPLAQILLRAWQEQALGWQQVGIWQGLVKLSDAWLQFATVVLANYYFPRLSRFADHASLHAEVRRTLLAGVAVLVPAAACIWLLREPLIRLLFAPGFLPMQELLAPQLLGDVFRTLAYVVGYVAVAKALTGVYIVAELYQAGALLLLSYLLLPVFGARAVPYAYCATYMLYCAICLAVYWRWHRRQPAPAP
jgi:O-antigen/teichoic acid export membrane protein